MAAEQGHVQTQTHVGYIYQSGEGVVQGHAEAMKWYRRAADQGEAAAQDNTGLLYNKGLGFEKDGGEAVV